MSSQLESLQRVTDAALAYLAEDELLAALLDRVTEILDSDTAAILMLEPGGRMLYARAAKGLEEEVEQGTRLPVGRGFAGLIAAERRAIAITDADHADILNPILREKGTRSLLGDPIEETLEVVNAGHLPPLMIDEAGEARYLRRRLAVHGATEEEPYDIIVACQEACANAVEHAYGPGHTHFEVETEHREARIRVIVRDHGRWRPPRGNHRGRCLPLMRAMDAVDVDHRDEGTVVVLERTLRPRSAA